MFFPHDNSRFSASTFFAIISKNYLILESILNQPRKMSHSLNIDKLDLQIISEMSNDASISYAELGKKLFVSGGTIHVRIKKLHEMGVIKGTRLQVNLRGIGYDVLAFIGIYLEKSSLYENVAKQLLKIPQIVRLNYTTGSYSMFAEIICRDSSELRKILQDDLQHIKGIERTETIISLEESFSRPINVSEAINL
jgi:Lrp/AsnC family transcriptional regulator for asnA, asnC and gidA